VSTRISSTTCRLALILAGAAAWTSTSPLTAAAMSRTTITVRVYQIAGLPSMLEQRTLVEAETVLQAARVDVRWRKCNGPTRSAGCDSPPGPRELLLVVRKEAPCEDSATLGKAFLVRRAGGVLATVYLSCVSRLAKAAETDVAVLLGRVAAHELGHLMMHSSRHARRGLMRPHWTTSEVRRNRAVDWAFTAGDVAAMRQPAPPDD
jgi:hypothetical protein